MSELIFKNDNYWKCVKQVIKMKDSTKIIEPVNLLYKFFTYDEITEFRSYIMDFEIYDYEENFFAIANLNRIGKRLYKGKLSRYNELPVEIYFAKIKKGKMILEININNNILIIEDLVITQK